MMHGKSPYPCERSPPRSASPYTTSEPLIHKVVPKLAQYEIGIEAERRRHQAPFTIARRLAGFP